MLTVETDCAMETHIFLHLCVVFSLDCMYCINVYAYREKSHQHSNSKQWEDQTCGNIVRLEVQHLGISSLKTAACACMANILIGVDVASHA